MRCVGCAMDPKNDTNLPKTVEFYFFSDPHSTHNLLICQLQVHFSRVHSPAYLRLFVGTIEGRWGPQGVKKGQKWGKIACFGVNPPYNSKPRCPSCPCCDILKVQRYAKQFQLEMKPEEMCGRCYGSKKRQKHTYSS